MSRRAQYISGRSARSISFCISHKPLQSGWHRLKFDAYLQKKQVRYGTALVKSLSYPIQDPRQSLNVDQRHDLAQLKLSSPTSVPQDLFDTSNTSFPMSLPQSASLNHLLSNNTQWAENFELVEPGFFQKSSGGQAPQVLWIGCADSRVPESLITGARPGDVFVHRNIANQVHLDDDNILSVLTYAVGSLGVRHVVVVGHSECGGAAACLNALQRPSISVDEPISTIPSLSPDAPLNRWLDPLTKHLRSLQLSDMPREVALPIVVQENVKRQVEHVCKTQPMIDAWSNVDPERRNVWVHGWVYDLASGRLRDLEISRGPAE